MKNLFFFACMVLPTVLFAQTNTFPTSGNVGIGTTTPALKLHLYKNSNYDPLLLLQDDLSDGLTYMHIKGTGHNYSMGVGNSSESTYGLANKFFIGDIDAQATRFVIGSNGNVGIGTVSPASLLDVNGASVFRNIITTDFGTTNRRVQLRDDGLYVSRTSDGSYVSSITANGIMTYSTRNHHRFFSNSSEVLTLLEGGNVGIGVATPTSKLHVDGQVYSTGLKLDPGNNIYWQDANTHIQRTVGNQLEFQEYTGSFDFKGMSGFSMNYTHPTFGSISYSFPSNQTFALTNKSAYVLQTSAPDAANCWIKLGTSQAQYANGPGAHLYLFGGIGGNVGVQNGGDVYIDAGEKGSVSAADGNILLGTQRGNVGIGTALPSAQLHATGSIRFAGLANDNALTRVIVSDANGNLSYRDATSIGSTETWVFGGNAVVTPLAIGTTNDKYLPFITNNTEQMRIGINGNVGIGTVNIADAGYKLFVETGIRTRKVKVDQSTWSDYVFYPGYYLRPLKEVEQYIQMHRHLPEVPSAEEVEKEGIDLGDNQAVLLKKIEELTLYIIEQHKQLEQQQKRIEALEKKSLPEKRSK